MDILIHFRDIYIRVLSCTIIRIDRNGSSEVFIFPEDRTTSEEAIRLCQIFVCGSIKSFLLGKI